MAETSSAGTSSERSTGFGPRYGASDHREATSHAPPPPLSVPTRKNSLALAAFVMSLISVWLPGLICGYIARRQIDRSGGAETGRGLATAAIVLGWVWCGIIVLILIASASAGGGSY